MKELGVWAAVIGIAALLVLAGVPFDAVGGTFAFLCVVAFIAVEFWNVTRLIAKFAAWLDGEPVPDSVDRSLGQLDRNEREYAGTRNAAQDLRRRKQ